MYILEEKPDLEYLAHFGVKGMKWGVRKKREGGSILQRARAGASLARNDRAHQKLEYKRRRENLKAQRKKKKSSKTPEQRAKERKRNIKIAGAALVGVGLVGGAYLAREPIGNFLSSMNTPDVYGNTGAKRFIPGVASVSDFASNFYNPDAWGNTGFKKLGRMPYKDEVYEDWNRRNPQIIRGDWAEKQKRYRKKW